MKSQHLMDWYAMNIFINTSNLIDYEKIKARSIRTSCGSDQSK